MRKLEILAALSAVALAASCSKSETPGYQSDPDAVRFEAVVGSMTRSNPVGTPEEQEVFNEGDRIGISNGGDFVNYVLNDGSWVPEDASRYLKWDGKNMTFRAYYPANNASSFESGDVYTNQNEESSLRYSDYMTVTMRSDKVNSLRIRMNRRTARVVVRIDSFRDEFDGANPVVSVVKVHSPLKVPYTEPYDPSPIESFNKDGVFHALVCPSEARPDQTFLELTVEYGDPKRTKTLTVKGVPAMEAGKSYTYPVIVGKNTVKVGSVSVKDWTTGEAIDDGQTESMVSWSGKTAPFALTDSEGNALGDSESDPILIENAEQLAYLAEQVNAGNSYLGKYFKQTTDINLIRRPWTPIGGQNKNFSGNFDGNGKKIYGLKVNATAGCVGLFGSVAGSIKNVVVESADIDASSGDVAVLCGYASYSTIENCTVRGTVESTGSRIGGLAGRMYNSSTMRGCTAEVSVKGAAFVGGLCGYVLGSTVSGCSIVNSYVEGTDDFYGGVGGIAGVLKNKNTVVEKCGFSGTVKGARYVGGAVGRLFQYAVAKVSDCTVLADILSGGVGGGLVGQIVKSNDATGESEFLNCGFDGTVMNTGTDTAQLGAAVGEDKSAATFTGCWYNADKIGDLPVVWSSVEDAAGKDYSGIEAKNLGK